MPRNLSVAFRRDIEASRATDVVLMFVTFNHESWEGPVYVVNDVVNYTYQGNFFIGFPFKLQLLQDDERPPKGQFVIQNVDRRIGELLMGLNFSPRLKVEILAASGWNTAIDGGTNSRLPIGSPVPEYVANRLQAWDVTVNPTTVTISFGPPDITQELWPAPRATKQFAPGLFR
jgi:hypothetical protein